MKTCQNDYNYGGIDFWFACKLMYMLVN